jgi:hypothetical protein
LTLAKSQRIRPFQLFFTCTISSVTWSQKSAALTSTSKLVKESTALDEGIKVFLEIAPEE